MISHEIAVILAAGAAAVFGFVTGRMKRVGADNPMPTPSKKTPAPLVEEPRHPYRDAAKRALEPEPKKVRVFKYKHRDGRIDLACPACGGGVTDFKVCTCDAGAREDSTVHFHVKCPHCALRFAMETEVTSLERRAAKAEAPPAKAEEPSSN